jgi:hypothetical protein
MSYLLFCSVVSGDAVVNEVGAIVLLLSSFVMKCFGNARICHKAFESIQSLKKQILVAEIESSDEFDEAVLQVNIFLTFF